MEKVTNSVEQAVFEAIDALNEQLPRGQKLDKTRDTRLLGAGGRLDSIGFINFVVFVEESCQQRGFSVSLTEPRHSGAPDPFQSVDSLIRHLEALISVDGIRG